MRFVMMVIGAVAWAGLTGAMAVGNIDFMTSLVPGNEPWHILGWTIQREWVFTAIAVSIDAVLIAAPFAIAESYRDRQHGRLLAAVTVWAIAVVFSLHSTHGWIEGFVDKKEAPVQQSVEKRADLDKMIEAEQKNLDAIRAKLREEGLSTRDKNSYTFQQTTSLGRISELQGQKWGTVVENKFYVMAGFSWAFAAALCAMNALVPFALFGTIRREWTVSMSGPVTQPTIVATGDWQPLQVSQRGCETPVPDGGGTPPEPRKPAAKKLVKPVASQPAKLRLVQPETPAKSTVVTDEFVEHVRTLKASEESPSIRKMADILTKQLGRAVSRSSVERALGRLKEESEIGGAAVA